MSAIQVFISYAHEDIEARKRLSKELQLLEYKGLVKSWHDGEILAGERWSDNIRDALGRSDLVILLISTDFTASNYIFKEELPLILLSHAEGKTRVIPILVRLTAVFDYIGIDHLQCLPQDEDKCLKAITTWNNKDKAWSIVGMGIIEVVEKLASAKNPQNIDTPKQKKFKLGAYHKYACDRIDQRDLFYELSKSRKDKLHYFYLYGEIFQSHSGMFQRFIFDMQNVLFDYLNPDLKPSCQNVSREITFELSYRENIYKQNIIKSILASFHIALNEEEPILDKNIHIDSAKV